MFDPLDPRDPVSTWTHGLGFLAALVVLPWLWRLGRGDRIRQLALLPFGVGLVACYGASMLAHGARLPDGAAVPALSRIDLVGIYLLIAGSYTPLAAVLLRGAWRAGALAWAWTIAGVASAWILSGATPPKPVSTGLYLAMGWGCVVLLVEVAPVVGRRGLTWLVLGGLSYTVGAVLDLAHWPTLVPGWVGPHEVFHLFVLGGSACHLRFMVREVVPYRAPALVSDPDPAWVADGAAGPSSGAHVGPHRRAGRPASGRDLSRAGSAAGRRPAGS